MGFVWCKVRRISAIIPHHLKPCKELYEISHVEELECVQETVGKSEIIEKSGFMGGIYAASRVSLHKETMARYVCVK